MIPDGVFNMWCSVAEASMLSGLSKFTIHKWIRTGLIPARGRRGTLRVRMDDVMPLRAAPRPAKNSQEATREGSPRVG